MIDTPHPVHPADAHPSPTQAERGVRQKSESKTRIENLLVVKIGGGEGLDMERCLDDLAQLAAERPVIVVHGVSAAMNALCDERGIEVRTITSPTGHTSRYTDPTTRDVFVEAAQPCEQRTGGGLAGARNRRGRA